MRVYEERSTTKRTNSCPTCGRTGHMWMTCTVPAKMMELKKQGKEPDITLYAEWYHRSYATREPNGKLYYHDQIFRTMQLQLDKQQARIEQREAKKARHERLWGKPAKRKTSCGFCGGDDHNRRNCTLMNNFVDDLTRASQNYRKKFYERLVVGQGFAEGALVALSASYISLKGRWVEDFEGIGIITDISWDTVNLGLTVANWEYRSNLTVTFLVDGETITQHNPLGGMIEADTTIVNDHPVGGDLAALFGSRWNTNGVKIQSILAPSENIPSQEWFNEGYTECWDWLTKKRNLSDIAYYLLPLIQKWHPSTRGRNAGKLKARIADYKSAQQNFHI